jgi:hypothetical protein
MKSGQRQPKRRRARGWIAGTADLIGKDGRAFDIVDRGAKTEELHELPAEPPPADVTKVSATKRRGSSDETKPTRAKRALRAKR